jgi:hypothetical protein
LCLCFYYTVLLTRKSWGGGVREMRVFLKTMTPDAIKDCFSILWSRIHTKVYTATYRVYKSEATKMHPIRHMPHVQKAKVRSKSLAHFLLLLKIYVLFLREGKVVDSPSKTSSIMPSSSAAVGGGGGVVVVEDVAVRSLAGLPGSL